VLESHHNTPMSRNDILKVILKEKLKDIRNSQSSLNTLSAMLYSNSRTLGGIFYKLPGRPGVYKLKKFAPHRRRATPRGSEDSSSAGSSVKRHQGNGEVEGGGTSNSWPPQNPLLRRGGSRARSPPAHGAKTAPPARAASASQQHCRRALKQVSSRRGRLVKQQRGTQSRRLSAKTLVLQYSLKKSLDVQATQPGKGSAVPSSQEAKSPAYVTRELGGRVQWSNIQLAWGLRCRRICEHVHKVTVTPCMHMDVDTPHSLLVNTELKALINVHTFAALPADFRKKLLSQLPPLDKEVRTRVLIAANNTALNNEFINVALAEWTHRLAEGAFTAEMQLRLKQEKERKVEAWKEEFFEDYYGQKSGFSEEEVALLMEKDDRG
uniref:HTH HARE-type domain-containing protein n=1 Tax=Petromyzon marinus TaxID=7757 RepID=S4RT52_PETMA